MFNTNAEDSYSYYDAQGRYLTTKHVYHLPDGTLKFTLDNTHSNPKDSFNLKNELLFYHLRNLVNTPKGETIYIVESEKDADTFEQFKMIAVCTYNGAGSGHFPRSVVPYFAGKNVVIFHANNNVSKQFAQEEASLVNPVTTSVKVIDLSEIWEIMPEQATIGDYLQSYGDAGLQQAKHLIENTPIWTAPKARTEAKYLPIRSVKDLMQQHFAPTEFLVNGILPSGLALLASPPKFGKSWFALQLCLAVAKGASFLGLSTTKSDVLYLDLEDGDADLQERIKKLNMGEDAPEGLLYSTEVPTIADGLVDMLHQTLCSNPSIKLVVIDGYFALEAALHNVQMYSNKDREIFVGNHCDTVLIDYKRNQGRRRPWHPSLTVVDNAPDQMREQLLRLFCGNYDTLLSTALCWLSPTEDELYDSLDDLKDDGIEVDKDAFLAVFNAWLLECGDKLALGQTIPDKVRKQVRKGFGGYGLGDDWTMPTTICDVMGWEHKGRTQEIWKNVLQRRFLEQNSESQKLYVDLKKVIPHYDPKHNWYRCAKCSCVTAFPLNDCCPNCGSKDIHLMDADALHHPKYGWTITSPALELLDFVEEQGWQDFQMVESLNLLDVLGTLPKGGNSSAGAETRTKKPSSTRKYICPKCGNSCRATKVINIICGDCMEKMVVAE